MKRKKGFTLVELLIYMGLLSIFLAILTQLFVTALNIQLESEATSTIEQDARHILTRLTYDIRRADTIVVPASLGESGTTMQLTSNGQTYTYSLSSDNLTITDPTGTYTLNGYNTSIDSLSFQKLGNPGGKASIQIHLTLESRTIQAKGQETKTIQTTLSTR